MNFGRQRIPHEASFDLTPMIDVVLLLIIFFTLTATFARTEQKMLDLPQQRGDAARAVLPAALFIDMDRDGALSILGVPMDLGLVVDSARNDSARLGADLDIVVRAHRDCPASHLNRLAEALAAAGIRNWKLGTALDGPASGGSTP